MSAEPHKQRLAAILAADAAGYSRLMGADEHATLAALDAARAVFRAQIESNQGRVIDMAGDSVLAVFETANGAVIAALAIQRALYEAAKDVAEDRRMRFRIGVHLGDIIEKADGTIYGDGVNIAARLQTLAEPGGISVSDAVRSSVKSRAGAVFESQGEHAVKNIAEPVRVYRVKLGTGGEATAAPPASEIKLSLPDKPSIAVLPFDNMSGDPEQEHFADGLVEDIITTLSKLSGLSVIARNSSFVYKGKAADVRQAANELGVRYVLEGSVRKAGDRIRITAQLIDAASGAHVWAERYDRKLEDIFAIQDEIMLILATEMAVKLTEGEQARLRYATTTNVEAWTHWMQGMSHYRTGVPTKERLGPARKCWEKALALDPSSASINAMLGFMSYADARFGWWDDRETALKKGQAYVDRAFEIDPDNADAHMVSGLLLMLQMRHAEAVAHARKSVDLAPGSADAAVFACFVLASSGFPEEAVTQIEKAIALSPRYPPTYLGHLGNAYRLAGRLDEAIAAFKEYGRRSPGFGLSDLVIAYQQKGDLDGARRAARALIAAKADFSVAGWAKTQQNRSDAEQVKTEMAALRAAGLP
ncbi:MAG: tetratricopeptide repeat protein [Betaproteobacteria bacterium]|nr:tetratricopeptide repeat protein [Betaproteobacteria bacterium]